MAARADEAVLTNRVFDAAYVKVGVAAHEDAVATFKDSAANGEDGPSKASTGSPSAPIVPGINPQS